MKKDILLSQFTTIGLGGRAKYFVSCKSIDDILYAVKFTRENNLNLQVISGGTNIIFPDQGYDGLVLKTDLKGIKISEKGKYVFVNAGAGENWDKMVKLIVSKGLTGIECLSGIPGSVGATPIQNVGAYGQEVKDTLVSVKAIDKKTLADISFTNSDINFGYRDSRFKSADHDKYIITEVTFRFEKNKKPEIKYEQLQKYIDSKNVIRKSHNISERISELRTAVITLRKSKSMIIDKDDPNSRSCGSFFMNPVLSESEYQDFKMKLYKKIEIPVFKIASKYKIPAAWLVEQAGFRKGFVKGGVGISSNHSLALININGTTGELLSLSDDVEKKVMNKFGIKLIKEPVIV